MNGGDPEEVMMDLCGLEPDYILELLEYEGIYEISQEVYSLWRNSGHPPARRLESSG